MKALELLKELIINMSSLNEDGYKFGRIRTYKAIQELEALEIKLIQGQENFNKLWDMYSELKKENDDCRKKHNIQNPFDRLPSVFNKKFYKRRIKKMEKYELMDTVMEQFDPREMASYIYANDKEFALQLLDFLGQEEMMEEDPRCC